MVTVMLIMICLVLLLTGIVAFLLCLIWEYDRKEKEQYTPVKPIEWDYTKERGWVDAEYSCTEEEEQV